jgi:hypothetical protein
MAYVIKEPIVISLIAAIEDTQKDNERKKTTIL